MLERLKARWKLKNVWQVVVVLLVFALTGTTVLLIKRPIMLLVSPEGNYPFWFSVLYYILILPVYNLILLIYGFIFGQFSFFWEFEKRFFNRMIGKKVKDIA
ncbi:MAG: prolipoprotein diacylglyceryl transferase [Saprospiraceae bacterium]|nr:prolipoprotein diacylglyceryl transferase [Saprospiraceae bacterium]